MTTKTYTSKQLELMHKQGLSKTDWQAIDAQPIQEQQDSDFNLDEAELIYPLSSKKQSIKLKQDKNLLELI